MPAKKKTKVATKKASVGRKTKEETKEEVVDDEETESDDDVSDEEEDETDDEDRGRGKRKRRESKNYEPDDFTMASANAASKIATVAKGRGKKLGEIQAVENNLKKYKLNSDELISAYKFLFSYAGTSNKKLMKDKLFEFSGYLPPLPKGKYDKQKQDDEDEVIETKFAIKAFKMNVSQIKALCNFFCVDYCDEDGKALIKEDMIDRLCDFLGEPNEIMIKQKEPVVAKKKAAAKPKKKAQTNRRTVALKVAEDPFALIKDYKKGKAPSDKALRQWVKAYIVCVDMETATTKDAVLTATAKFGVEMASKKARIKELLAEEI